MEIKELLNRRNFVKGGASAAALALAGCQTTANQSAGSGRSFALAYGARPNEPFPIPALQPDDLSPKFRRQRVTYQTKEPVGTVIVDTSKFFLYHVEPNGKAMRYGVGLGRQGFEWSGAGVIKWKQHWPKWFPPREMIQREPHLEKYSAANGGHPPGLKNPLGARALYIFQNGKDTLYRLHGSRNATSIGKAVSSGCVRLVNQDVIDLYNRVKPGSKIVVV